MNAKILYANKKGKCAKVARAISESFQIPMVAATPGLTLEPLDLLIIVGGGELSGEKDAGIEPIIKNLKSKSIKGALLISLNAYTARSGLSLTRKGKLPLVNKFLEEKEIPLFGEKVCNCQFSVLSFGHPSRGDIEDVKKWVAQSANIRPVME